MRCSCDATVELPGNLVLTCSSNVVTERRDQRGRAGDGTFRMTTKRDIPARPAKPVTQTSNGWFIGEHAQAFRSARRYFSKDYVCPGCQEETQKLDRLTVTKLSVSANFELLATTVKR